jgi:hypothetical protein
MSDRSVHRPAARIVVLPTLIVMLCVSACGSSARYVDSAKVERAIADSVLAEHGIHSNVQCPTRIPQRAGEQFACGVRLDAGTYWVSATEVGGAGKVRYRSVRPLVTLNIAKVQHAIATSVLQQRRLHVNVECPREVLQEAGTQFRCSAAVNGDARRYYFLVSEADNAGHVRYVGI